MQHIDIQKEETKHYTIEESYSPRIGSQVLFPSKDLSPFGQPKSASKIKKRREEDLSFSMDPKVNEMSFISSNDIFQ